jgi:tungstate transport system ATP-binding protein
MTGAYQLHGIEYAYGDEPVLRINDYVIEQNAVTALVGANGSGKSTLLNLLAFVTTPSRGEMHFFGKQVLNGKAQELRRQTAYVQQKPYLFNFTVFQNIELGLKLRGMALQLRRVRVEAQAATLKLSDLLEKRAHELSGGEIQKVAIARALVLEPRVLILDEPFSHLDKGSKADITTLLRGIAESGSQTIIFSSHDQLQAQQLADHVCSLGQGRIMPRLLINTFSGRLDVETGVFDTGKLAIYIPSAITAGSQLAIESTHLVLSKDKLESSMRNQFRGRVKSLQEAYGEVHVIVEAGESWHVIITHAALSELNINLGEEIWLSFKSSAVHIF